MFENKVIVITGGASGIGAAIGERFGKNGARVAILDFDPGALKITANRFEKAGIDVLGIRCDVTSERQCESAMKKVIKHFGGVDILVNNAGITQRSTFRYTDLSVYRKVLDVNFFGSLNCTKPALESLIRRKGTIVVTTSLAGFAPLYGRTGYSASKHALHGFFHSLRTELAHFGVHVMMLCPNFTATNLQNRALNGTGKKNIGERNIVGKEATPESVAEAVFYGVLKKKRELILTPMGKLVYILTRILPSFYERKMTAKIKPEFDRSEGS